MCLEMEIKRKDSNIVLKKKTCARPIQENLIQKKESNYISFANPSYFIILEFAQGQYS